MYQGVVEEVCDQLLPNHNSQIPFYFLLTNKTPITRRPHPHLKSSNSLISINSKVVKKMDKEKGKVLGVWASKEEAWEWAYPRNHPSFRGNKIVSRWHMHININKKITKRESSWQWFRSNRHGSRQWCRFCRAMERWVIRTTPKTQTTIIEMENRMMSLTKTKATSRSWQSNRSITSRKRNWNESRK